MDSFESVAKSFPDGLDISCETEELRTTLKFCSSIQRDEVATKRNREQCRPSKFGMESSPFCFRCFIFEKSIRHRSTAIK